MDGPSTSTRTLRDHLREDFALQQLVDGLTLADRFHFYVLLCPSPRVADEALGLVLSEVSARRSGGAELFRIDPYLAHPDLSKPIEYETLIQELLEPLVHPVEYPANGVVIADASRAIWKDEEAWRGFFGRLNERRNVVVERLHVPLILSMPLWMERVFAETAPDFWAIQSLTAKVEAPETWESANLTRVADSVAPSQAGLDRLTLTPTSLRPAEVWPAERPERAAKEVPATPANGEAHLLADHPAEAIEAHAAALRQALRDAFSRGDRQEARRLAHARVAVFRALVSTHPDRLDWHADLASALDQEAAIARNGESAALLEEAAGRLEGLVERDPRPDWRASLGRVLEGVARTAQSTGDLPRARQAADRASQIARALMSREPSSPLHVIDYARRLVLASRIARKSGSAEAPALLDHAIGEVRTFLPNAPEGSKRALRLLLQMALFENARAREREGRVSEAIRLAEEAAILIPDRRALRAARVLIRRARASLGDADRGLSILEWPPTKVYISYADGDQQAAIELEEQMSPLSDAGGIRIWHRGKLRAGEPIRRTIARERKEADVFVVLLSADYFTSDEHRDEARVVLAAGSRREAEVILVRARPCSVEGWGFAGWQVLPAGAPSIQALPVDERWSQVVSRLEEVIAQRTRTTGAGAPSSQ